MEIAEKYIKQGYSVKLILFLVEVSRSTYYYWKGQKKQGKSIGTDKKGCKPRGFSISNSGMKISDKYILNLIKDILSGECCCYGYKKVTALLRIQYQIRINKKKVYRLMLENGLLKPKHRKYAHRARIDERKVERPDQFWATDIKFGYVDGEDKTFYMINYIDICTRELVGSYTGYSMSSRTAVKTLDKAIRDRGIDLKGLIIRSDNGSQYISSIYEAYCGLKGIYHEFTHARCPEENGHAEAYHGILEAEVFRRNEFETLEEARAIIADWEDFYNNRRFHWGLNLKTPRQAYEEYLSKTENEQEKVS